MKEDWTDRYCREFEEKIRKIEEEVKQGNNAIGLLKEIYKWTYDQGVCGAFDEDRIAEELSIEACRKIISELIYHFKI